MNDALDDFLSEMDFNVAQGEMSVTFSLVCGDRRIAVSGYDSDAWSRKEVDGRLSPEQPAWMPSVVVPLYMMLEAGITIAQYDTLKVERNGEVFSVVSHTGADPVRLFIKASSDGDCVEPDDPTAACGEPVEPDL